MKFSPDLLKAVDHCQHRSFITNKYTGARIAVDCGHCDYCIHKRAKKASMRVKTAASAFKYSFFVTLTFDNEHIPLMCCKVLHSDYEDAVGISGDIHFGHEHHQYIPVSEYKCDDSSMLRHIFFEQVQGTVPFDREVKEYAPVNDNWFLSMDAIRSFIAKSQSVNKTDYPASSQYGRDNLIPFLNYVDVQNYIKRLRKHLFKKLGSYETLHFYAVGYATSRQTALCLDAGHFHPTEVISDKISAAMLYVPQLLLHVSRPVRWDSDHVVLLDDETQAIASEIVRHDLFDRVHIGLDFFDASINRIAAWVIGTRNMKKALLRALLEPTAELRKLEAAGDYTARLALLEEQKSLPWQAVWEMYCQRHDTPAGSEWLESVRAYEKEILSRRG